MADRDVAGPAWNTLREIRGTADDKTYRTALSPTTCHQRGPEWISNVDTNHPSFKPLD